MSQRQHFVVSKIILYSYNLVPSENTTYKYQQIDSILEFWQHVLTVKSHHQAKNRTMSRYNEGVHSMGFHIIYNCWYIKSHMWADIKRRKSQINKLKYIIQCVKY